MKAKIYNHKIWVTETNPQKLNHYIGKLLKNSGFKIIGTLEYHFHPQGYTSIFLLSESHCAIHTFPERQKSYIELSSCIWNQFIKFKKNFNLIKTLED